MRRGPRWLKGELRDRLLTRQGHMFGREFPILNGGHPEPQGELERYFDAHTEGPGIWKWRHYFPIYERHLQRFRGRDVHLVEIGVFSGGSLPMWRDYLGPRSRITGVDIEPACKAYEGDGIRVVIGDQADPAFWRQFLTDAPPVDVVIDDGSHRPADQIATLKAVLPSLRAGGVYICEDAHSSDSTFGRFVDGLARNLDVFTWELRADGGNASMATAFQRAVVSVCRYPFVTVIERTQTPVERLEGPRHGTEWQPFL
jgi:Methyltransferase domain